MTENARCGVSHMLLACGMLTLSVPPAASSQNAPAAPSVLAGAYTEAQAIRGQDVYYAHCLSCHGEAMAGLDQAPPLAGPQFASIWQGEPLEALVDRIATMPPAQPGSLPREEYVAVLAYMLWYNGLPIGEAALSADENVLARMKFELPPLAGR